MFSIFLYVLLSIGKWEVMEILLFKIKFTTQSVQKVKGSEFFLLCATAVKTPTLIVGVITAGAKSPKQRPNKFWKQKSAHFYFDGTRLMSSSGRGKILLKQNIMLQLHGFIY